MRLLRHAALGGAPFEVETVIEIRRAEDAQSSSCQREFAVNGPHRAVVWRNGSCMMPERLTEGVPFSEHRLSETQTMFRTSTHVSFDRINWFPVNDILRILNER